MDECRHSGSTLVHCALEPFQGVVGVDVFVQQLPLDAHGPVVRYEDNDGVVVQALLLEALHDLED